MKIQFYAPDTSMPPGTDPGVAGQFRDWAMLQLLHAYRRAVIEVLDTPLLDASYQVCGVEGMPPILAAEVHTFCGALPERFFAGSPAARRGRQCWVGSACQWKAF